MFENLAQGNYKKNSILLCSFCKVSFTLNRIKHAHVNATPYAGMPVIVCRKSTNILLFQLYVGQLGKSFASTSQKSEKDCLFIVLSIDRTENETKYYETEK
jgi:hypothetical protein